MANKNNKNRPIDEELQIIVAEAKEERKARKQLETQRINALNRQRDLDEKDRKRELREENKRKKEKAAKKEAKTAKIKDIDDYIAELRCVAKADQKKETEKEQEAENKRKKKAKKARKALEQQPQKKEASTLLPDILLTGLVMNILPIALSWAMPIYSPNLWVRSLVTLMMLAITAILMALTYNWRKDLKEN